MGKLERRFPCLTLVGRFFPNQWWKSKFIQLPLQLYINTPMIFPVEYYFIHKLQCTVNPKAAFSLLIHIFISFSNESVNHIVKQVMIKNTFCNFPEPKVISYIA